MNAVDLNGAERKAALPTLTSNLTKTTTMKRLSTKLNGPLLAGISALLAMMLAVTAETAEADTRGALLYADNKTNRIRLGSRPEDCKDDESIVLFGNGINNSYATAKSGRVALAKQFASHLATTGQTTKFGDYRTALAFNESGFANNPMESVGEDGFDFVLDYLTKVLPDVRFLDASDAARAQYLAALNRLGESDPFTANAKLRMLSYDEQAARSSRVVGDHEKGYNRALDLGRKMVVLGHSHGTIVSNIVYQAVKEKRRDGFGVVHAASMQDRVAGSERFFGRDNLAYVTIEEDGVAATYGETTRPNFHWNVDEFVYEGRQGFLRGHGFEEWYMSQSAQRNARSGGTGTAYKVLSEYVIGTQDGLLEKPCHGFTYTTPGGEREFIGWSSDGDWRADYRDQAPTDLSTATGASSQHAFVDWKGRYKSDEPTVVLSWQGSTSRYHLSGSRGTGRIYMDGEEAYRAPYPVVGAAVQYDANDEPYIIAATLPDGRQIHVFQKKAEERNVSTSRYDPNTGEGWRYVGLFNLPAAPMRDTSLISPVLFNGDASKATMLVEERESLTFSRRIETDGCTSGAIQRELCKPGPDGWEAEYAAGSREVSVLKRYALGVTAGASPSLNITVQPHEVGKAALVATDYLDGKLLELREVNVEPARGSLNDPDVGPSAGAWLELNGQSLTLPDIIDCDDNGAVCRPTRSIAYLGSRGGFVRELPKGHALHILSIDLRNESFFYSHRNDTRTQYAIVHDGDRHVLADIPSGPTERQDVYATSRYGYEASYANRIDVKRYFDDVAGKMEDDPIKKNIRLGQFEQWPAVLVSGTGTSDPYAVTIAKIPEQFGMVTSASKTTLLSATLPNGRIVNWHSGAPGKDLGRQIESDLSGGNVLPVMTR